MTTEEALAWVELPEAELKAHADRWWATHSAIDTFSATAQVLGEVSCVLADRVRELEQALVVEQSEVEALAEQRNDWKAEAEKFLACIRELEGRTCLKCEHQRWATDTGMWCNRLTMLARGKYPIYCKDVNGSCGAFMEKTHAV